MPDPTTETADQRTEPEWCGCEGDIDCDRCDYGWVYPADTTT